MPIPSEYFHASRDFESFMLEARNASGLHTTNMAWNMVVGVLQAFRRRLEVRDAIRFAGALPAGIRSLFVADWDTSEPRRQFSDAASLLDEIRSVRPQHNFSPEHAREAVAFALWKQVDPEQLTEVLRSISENALAFWQLTGEQRESLQQTREPLVRHVDDAIPRAGFDPFGNLEADGK